MDMKMKILYLAAGVMLCSMGYSNDVVVAATANTQVSAETMAAVEISEQDLDEARVSYICALANTAAYSQELNQAVLKEMEKLGWKFDSYRREDRRADARYYLVNHKNTSTGSPELLVVIPGTEGKKDVEVNLRFSKVLYGGSTVEEFQARAAINKVPEDQPMVHRGFNDYTMTAFFLKGKDNIAGIDDIRGYLKNNPKSHVYLTGHSLGGAVATILGARMISADIAKPEQISIYTYGAPAVGNEAFAKTIGNSLDLHRYVMGGDPVKNVLQLLKSGYVQFGTEYKWKKNKNSQRFSHQIIEYLDSSIRNYYDIALQGDVSVEKLMAQNDKTVRSEAGEANRDVQAKWFSSVAQDKVFLAPCMFQLDSDIENDRAYIDVISADFMLDRFQDMQVVYNTSGIERLSEADRLFALCRKAEQVGCSKVITRSITGVKERNSSSLYNLSTEVNIYNTSGVLENSYMVSSNTEKMSVIEAVLYGMARINDDVKA